MYIRFFSILMLSSMLLHAPDACATVVTPDMVADYASQLRRHLHALALHPVGYQAQLFYKQLNHAMEEARTAWQNGSGLAFLGVYMQELRKVERTLVDTYEAIMAHAAIAQGHECWSERDEYEETLAWLAEASGMIASEIVMYEKYVLLALDTRV